MCIRDRDRVVLLLLLVQLLLVGSHLLDAVYHVLQGQVRGYARRE